MCINLKWLDCEVVIFWAENYFHSSCRIRKETLGKGVCFWQSPPPACPGKGTGSFGSLLLLRLDSTPCCIRHAKARDSESSKAMEPRAKFRVIEANGEDDEIQKTETFLEKARV